MTISALLQVSENTANFVVSSFINKKLHENIIPTLLSDETSSVEELKIQFGTLLVSELTQIYDKLEIQLSEKTVEYWKSTVSGWLF